MMAARMPIAQCSPAPVSARPPMAFVGGPSGDPVMLMAPARAFSPKGRIGAEPSWSLEYAFQTKQQCDQMAADFVARKVAQGATHHGGNFVSGVKPDRTGMPVSPT